MAVLAVDRQDELADEADDEGVLVVVATQAGFGDRFEGVEEALAAAAALMAPCPPVTAAVAARQSLRLRLLFAASRRSTLKADGSEADGTPDAAAGPRFSGWLAATPDGERDDG